MPPKNDHSQSQELECISDILDSNPTMCEKVLQDLNPGKNIPYTKDANVISAKQIIRNVIVKVLFKYLYKYLAYYISDYRTISWFRLIGIADLAWVFNEMPIGTENFIVI